jgi:hypothetical protein
MGGSSNNNEDVVVNRLVGPVRKPAAAARGTKPGAARGAKGRKKVPARKPARRASPKKRR